ncbi:MaoC family dehydratase [Candidatus Woesearchaeota archaeon]|nr:MaoC family dehydratase [Candidatus Woesearchaeota archaeon]
MAVIDQKVRITPSVIDGPLGERDPNPIHKSDAEAQNQGYKGRLVHGVFPIAVAADYVAVYLENHGIPNGWAITKVKVDFKRPLFLDDVLETGVQVIKASSYDITSLNQDGKKIIEGKIEVGSPSHPPPETLARPWDPAAYLTDAASGVYYWLDLVRLGNPFNGAKQKIVAAGDYHKKYFDINPGETAHDSRLVALNGQRMKA